MSFAQPHHEPERLPRSKRVLPQLGVGLLAVACVVVILLTAFAKVQDAADRTH
jgi:hypothetical protein